VNRLRRLRARPDEGATLIEMLVALMIFGIVSTALLALLLSTASMVGTTKQRSIAVGVAATVIDETRAQGAVAVAPGRTTMTRTVGGRDYTVVRDAQFVARGATSSCTSPGVPSFLRVRVAVEWDGMGAIRPVESNTLLAPRVGDVDAASGNVGVTVVDRSGAPLPGVPVTLITGGSTTGSGPVQRTTADGCAFFAFIPPGTYTARLDKGGYVDVEGKAAPAKLTSVIASTTASLSFTYDRAATVSVRVNTDAAHPAPADLPVLLHSPTAFSGPTWTRLFTGAWPLTIPGLFPDRAGYSGWAGACLASDPGSAARPAPVAAEPGGSSELVIGVAKFEIRLNRAAAPGTSVVATYAGTAVPGKPETASCSAPAPVQRHTWQSAVSTSVLGGALPYGDWTFTVREGSRTVLTPAVKLKPGAGTTLVQVTLP
jgi:type II secretory pathway pseudopilin PulG